MGALDFMTLAPFHPLIREWFLERFRQPTEVQAHAWPQIAAGRNVLVTAPTGTGKTLAAFLWAIDRLIVGAWPRGGLRVLYVSPLKALNNDVQLNLVQPLSQLHAAFTQTGRPAPGIRVLTRSGDTPPSDRRRMLSRPPEILITTPESLNLLLASKNARRMFTGVVSVILDEIHAVAGTKRGTHLMTAVDRLVPLCGEFQRIALSATLRPAARVADFVGGYVMDGDARDPAYRKRPVTLVSVDAPKHMAVQVCFPQDARRQLADGSWWPALTSRFAQVIDANTATLLFANSRRLTEKVTRLINETTLDPPIAYAHHGSLSKELRLTVEQRLKSGALKAIVATSSLELGIDIGALDQVVLIQTPPTVASALQRIGRSGHGVGETSRGAIYPTHGRDFLNAAVMARCIADGDIEALQPPAAPLDVLAQVVLSMTVTETWDVDALFAFLRTSSPYHALSRQQFDRVLDMLAGVHAQTRIRELAPKIYVDRIDNTVRAKRGAAMTLFMAGGTIPDRGYFNLRLDGSDAKIGELDEEFVWERRIGDTFALGTQTWRIAAITHNDVTVTPAGSGPGIFPFWKAEARNRDFHLAEKIAVFLEEADEILDRGGVAALHKLLGRRHAMDENAAGELVDFLVRQKAATRTSLPHRHHLLVEHFDDPLNRSDAKQVILHTHWGGRINRPFAMALSAAWEQEYGWAPELFADDDAVILLLPHAFSAVHVLDLVSADNLDALLRRRLESTGFFGARFREIAGRAMLLPRVHFKKRMPLWLNRLRAKKLMAATADIPDFPLLLETWRTCLQDHFDLPQLALLLEELADGRIRIAEARTTAPSPFARGLVWQQTNRHMYEDDRPEKRRGGLSEELYREVAGTASLRPRFSDDLIADLEHKLQRTAPGYAPPDPQELLAWTAERLLISASQWQQLLSAMQRDHGVDAAAAIAPVADRLLRLRLPGARTDVVCALQNLPRIAVALDVPFETLQPRPIVEDAPPDDVLRRLAPLTGSGSSESSDIWEIDHLIAHWLGFHGPHRLAVLSEVLGVSGSALEQRLARLVDAGQAVVDRIRESAAGPEVCDRENLEILLRMARKARRPVFTALAADQLLLYTAAWQGLTRSGDDADDLARRLEQLFGLPMPAAALEEHVLPARLRGYSPDWLDSLVQSSSLCWTGCGKEKVLLSFEEDRELFPISAETPEEGSAREEQRRALLPQAAGRYPLVEIARRAGRSTAEAAQTLWDLAWHGRAGNDTFAALRQGILTRYKPAEPHSPRAGRRRGRFDRWKQSRPMTGNWYAIPPESDTPDDLQTAELERDRVRLLLERYGVLFRERLSRELPALQWSRLFRTLRLMELSGEILTGHFFHGIPGLQYASPAALRFLNRKLPLAAVYWMNAADPASLCGLGLEAFKAALPPRHATTWLVFHGAKLMMVARRNAAVLDIRVPPDHPRLPEGFDVFRVLLDRRFNPRRRVVTETINGQSALQSPFSTALKAFGFVEDYRALELRPAV